MKIVRLTASNVLRLTAVDITPEGNTVIISGKNAQGKSSVLNSIWLALDYASAHKSLTKPLHGNEAEGEVTLDLGDFTVIREFSGEKTRLKVENTAGARYPSPQAMLDKLIGSLSFDPVAFATMRDDEQVKVLRDLVGLDFSDMDRERKEVYEERTIINRQLKEAEALLADMPKPEADAPVDLLKIEDLQQKIREADERQHQYDALTREIDSKQDKMLRLLNEEKEVEEQIERLKARLELLLSEGSELAGDIAVLQAQQRKIKLPNRGALIDQLASVNESNEKIRQREAYHKQQAKAETLDATAYQLTVRITEIDQAKEKALAGTAMPIEGLSFDESQVLYNGVPFRQASQAEQLRVSMAMAMALNPELRVIRVLDASLLDEDNMAIIKEMAEEHDFQVWLEVVQNEPGMGVFIEDGKVKE